MTEFMQLLPLPSRCRPILIFLLFFRISSNAFINGIVRFAFCHSFPHRIIKPLKFNFLLFGDGFTTNVRDISLSLFLGCKVGCNDVMESLPVSIS